MKNWTIADIAARVFILAGVAFLGYAEGTSKESFAVIAVLLSMIGFSLITIAKNQESKSLKQHDEVCDKQALDVAQAAGYNTTHEAATALSTRSSGQSQVGHELGKVSSDMSSTPNGSRKDTYYVVVPSGDNSGSFVAKPVDSVASPPDGVGRPNMSHFQRIVSAVQRLEQQYKVS